jgi:putative ABC transport system permease protein
MKARLYANYTARSLMRGGQRTLLAIFCVAVGVMAIVALELAGNMVNLALTSNVQALNGGDIAVTKGAGGSGGALDFSQQDIQYFRHLEQQGQIVTYTAVSTTAATATVPGTDKHTFAGLEAVDPARYPLYGQTTFLNPTSGSLDQALRRPDALLVNQALYETLGLHPGEALRLTAPDGTVIDGTVAAEVKPAANNFGGLGGLALLSRASYVAALKQPLTYTTVYIATSSQAQADSTAKAIQKQFPLATVQTAHDVLKRNQQQVDMVNKFLELAGLLALLIGGVGIVNTMQVALSRRRTEIAMLKTSGYQRRDLYALFGLEALLLGIAGGALGAVAGIGLSDGVRVLIERAFGLSVPFAVSAGTVASGLAVGVATTLIFGLLPIVQAGGVRPLAVLRELPEGRGAGSRLLTVGLVLLLAVLFGVLASVVLNSALWGASATAGAFVALGVLSLFFLLIVLLLSALPIPRLINVKMALRNLARQRARTTITLLALFAGIFAVGLIAIVGQDVRQSVNAAIASSLKYNVLVSAPTNLRGTLDTTVQHLSGVEASTVSLVGNAEPVTIDGTPIAQLLDYQETYSKSRIASSLAAELLSGVQGYSLRQQQPDLTIDKGRNLTAADAGTDNVLVDEVETEAPLHLKVGDTLTLVGPTHHLLTVHIVGFYANKDSLQTFAPLQAAQQVVTSLHDPRAQLVYSLRIAPGQVDQAVAKLNQVAPQAQVFNFSNITELVNQILGNIVILLIAIASLALFAGVVIIANAVALAMLERRRELGILKSVGYDSARVLRVVLIENGVMGAVGGALGALLAAIVTLALSGAFKTHLDVNVPIAMGLVALAIVLAIGTAALVAWGAVRIRPLEVLRYE